MIFNNGKVEEDLKRIRWANLPDDVREREEREREKARQELEKITFGEIISMIIAVFSILAPYLLTFLAVMTAIAMLLSSMK